ncbi:MAG TPA: class I adenylate-forming enzyme family protein, partial [Casimicrobium huifangae]|nr:class I adenylate-forming enzyme family protein [Casimicrobium huifangae]
MEGLVMGEVVTAPASPIPPFVSLSDLIRGHASERPDALALSDGRQSLTYAALDAQMDRVAASLQRDGLRAGDVVSVCAAGSVRYALVFLAALRAGIVVAPLAPSSTAASLRSMLHDAEAKLLFLDAEVAALLDAAPDTGEQLPARIALDDSAAGQRFDDWLADGDA